MIGGRSDTPKVVIESGQAFGMTDEEIAAGDEPPRQPRDQLLLGLAIEVDHDVTAEDHLEALADI